MLLPEPARDVLSRPFFLHQSVRVTAGPEKNPSESPRPYRNLRLEPSLPLDSTADAT